jgi:hypothetical protein
LTRSGAVRPGLRHQTGPAEARRVLVLMPGTQGRAGDFELLARDLAERVPGIQIWSIDRRSQPLEDTSLFARLEAGEASLQEMFDYYLGWIVNESTFRSTRSRPI